MTIINKELGIYRQPGGMNEVHSRISVAPVRGYSQPAGIIYSQLNGMTQSKHAQGVLTTHYKQYPSAKARYNEQQTQVNAGYSDYPGHH